MTARQSNVAQPSSQATAGPSSFHSRIQQTCKRVPSGLLTVGLQNCTFKTRNLILISAY